MFNDPGATRTLDPCLKRALLYQLSYKVMRKNKDSVVNCTSHIQFAALSIWAQQDLNLRPADYESAALTN